MHAPLILNSLAALTHRPPTTLSFRLLFSSAEDQPEITQSRS